MDINQVLIEYAKLHLSLTQANYAIAQLQAKIEELAPKKLAAPGPVLVPDLAKE